MTLAAEDLKLMCDSLVDLVEKKDHEKAKILAFSIYRTVQAWSEEQNETTTDQSHNAVLDDSNTSDTSD